MSRRLFGTDGIRGLANRGDMTPEVAFRIGAAIAYQAAQQIDHMPRIVVGKDTRLSGYLFETAVASGICALGGEVLLSGPLPTPAIAHLTTSMRADAGVVISASHNPYQDNGIKIFGPRRLQAAGRRRGRACEALIFGADLRSTAAGRPATSVGRAVSVWTMRPVATWHVRQERSFPARTLTLDGDEGGRRRGARRGLSRTAPLIFSELGAKVYTRSATRPDGREYQSARSAPSTRRPARAK